MKYKNIQNLVPDGEHFDESAIVNEGGFLSVNHLAAIDDALENTAAVATELNTANEALATANANISSLTTERNGAQNSLQTANNTIASQATKIASLEVQITALGKQESGNGSVVVTNKDDHEVEQTNSGKPKYNDPDHPANKAANKWVKGSVTK